MSLFWPRTFQSPLVWVSAYDDDGGPHPPLSPLPSDARHVRGVRAGDESHAGGPGVDRPLRATRDQAVRHDSTVNFSSGIKNFQ